MLLIKIWSRKKSEKIRNYLEQLSDVNWMVSNVDHEYIRELFKNHKIIKINNHSAIGYKKLREVLIKNRRMKKTDEEKTEN